MKLIADYTGLNFIEIQNLYIDEYKLLLREAYIYKLEQTEAGQEALETAWILEQTNPDRETLRETFGKESE